MEVETSRSGKRQKEREGQHWIKISKSKKGKVQGIPILWLAGLT